MIDGPISEFGLIENLTNKEVPDASLTGEVWVTKSVKLKVVGKILVGEPIKEPLKYYYGDNEAEIYRWNYEELPLLNE